MNGGNRTAKYCVFGTTTIYRWCYRDSKYCSIDTCNLFEGDHFQQLLKICLVFFLMLKRILYFFTQTRYILRKKFRKQENSPVKSFGNTIEGCSFQTYSRVADDKNYCCRKTFIPDFIFYLSRN